MNLEEVLNFRRSVRNFSNENLPDVEKVKHCLELASLAPNSSNMQLWEFYHITDPEVMNKMGEACLSQSAATTAPQMVVFVTRQDLHRKRAKQVIELTRNNILRNSPAEKQQKRIKIQELYYGKVMPFLYSRFFGLLGVFRKLLTTGISLFRPMTTFVSESDARVVAHKSCGLAAQTFMIAMAAEGYDTCPLEGFDGRRVKKLLHLPYGAEVNMVIPCGIRNGNKGIWGDRIRLPFNEVYKHI
jgi:nitroreductase